MKINTIIEIISLFFVILFLYTGISKIGAYSVFKEQIASSPIFEHTSSFVAVALPISEFIVSILLFWPAWRLIGLYGTLVLMILFTGYVMYILNTNDKLPCSCGGVIELLSWKGHLVFNIAMILLASIGILLYRQNIKPLAQSTIPKPQF